VIEVSPIARITGAVLLTAWVALSAGGCLAATEVSGNEPPTLEPVESEQPGSSASSREGFEAEGAPLWSCTLAPTYDRDWHNDVLCTNGVDSERPYLREGDDFVTTAEILGAARDYEAKLNAHAFSPTDSSPFSSGGSQKKLPRGGDRFCDSHLAEWIRENGKALQGCD
jgi:hypothetical protein